MPKKQKVASGKAATGGSKKMHAEASAPQSPVPAAPRESRRKRKEDTAQETAPSASALQQHVSSPMLLFSLGASSPEEPPSI